MDRDTLSDLFAKARDADIEAVAGVKLFRAGRRMRGECPVCGASKGKRSDGAFSVDLHQGYWYCFGGCQRGGDVVDLEQLLRGGSLREAAERLAGRIAPLPSNVRRFEPGRVVDSRPVSGPERVAAEIWRDADRPVWCSPGDDYLSARGLSIREPLFLAARKSLRFSGGTKWGFEEGRGWLLAPAIVARPMVAGPGWKPCPTGGVHVTYLSPNCREKSRFAPAKRMWGPQKDLEGRPGGVWLSDGVGEGPLVVGEGIESTLSAMQLVAGERGHPVRGVATLSLEALQGGWLPDRFGRVDLDQVAADPDRPAFTWPDQSEVLIAVDRDMKPVKKRVRKRGGGTAEVWLDAEDRARICAGLAAQAWKRAGANAVRVIAPAAGRDFNDELIARVGA